MFFCFYHLFAVFITTLWKVSVYCFSAKGKKKKTKMFYNHGIIIVVRIILAIIIKIQVFIKLHVVLETLKQSVKEFFTKGNLRSFNIIDI